jgi:hypothetical protein
VAEASAGFYLCKCGRVTAAVWGEPEAVRSLADAFERDMLGVVTGQGQVDPATRETFERKH